MLESSRVVIDPKVSQVTDAVCGQTYEIPSQDYKVFTLPAGYTSSAGILCRSVSKCISVEQWIEEQNAWRKFSTETNTPDFAIASGDKIGIMTSETSEVEFCPMPTVTK